MNIKNYTSTINASRSMARIEELLVEIGATNINEQYENKTCTGITFLLYDQQLQQTLAFHLKAPVEDCFQVLWKDVKRPRQTLKPPSSFKPPKPPGKSSPTGQRSNVP